MNKHGGNRLSYGLIAVLTIGLLIGGIMAVFVSNPAFAVTLGDAFDDNSKDLAKWGADEVDGKGVLTEINQRLEYTSKGTVTASHDSVDRKWVKTRFSYNADWAIQMDVTNTTSSSTFSSFGIDIRSVRLPDDDIEVELGQAGLFWAEFSGGKKISGEGWAASSGPNTYGAIHIAFDSKAKVFTVYYDTDPGDGYQWTEFGSFGVAGTGGVSGTRQWGLTSTDQFAVYVFGYSEKMSVTSGQLYGDNFLETDGGMLSTSHDELGGGESKATAVATLVTKTCVAVSGKQGDGNWYGQVRVNKPNGTLKWKSPSFSLNGGRTTAIAASGTTAYGDGYFYVAGYYGTAGSGSEQVFVRAYDEVSKAFKWEYKVDAPNAGLYPMGVVARGSNVVGFYNTDTGTVRGKLIGLKQLSGALKWQSNFGDDTLLSSKVNAIAINGSKVAVAGYNQDNPDFKWFSYSIYFATTGKWDGGGGTHMSGPENEALAVAWSGSIVGVVGYLSPDASSHNAYAKYIKIFPDGGSMDGVVESVWDLGNDSRFTAAAVKDKKIYAAGHWFNGTEQVAFVRTYGLADPYTPAFLWGDTFELSSSGGMVPTGITLGVKGVYVTGYGFGAPDVTDWFVKAYTPSGQTRWLDDFNLNGGSDTKAFGIATSSSAVVAVGQAQDGPGGPFEAIVRSYSP